MTGFSFAAVLFSTTFTPWPGDSVIGTFCQLPVTNDTVSYDAERTLFRGVTNAFRVSWKDYAATIDAFLERTWFTNLRGYDPCYLNRVGGLWDSLVDWPPKYTDEPRGKDLKSFSFADYFNPSQWYVGVDAPTLDMMRDLSGMWRIAVNYVRLAKMTKFSNLDWPYGDLTNPCYLNDTHPVSTSIIGSSFLVNVGGDQFESYSNTVSQLKDAINAGNFDTLSFLASWLERQGGHVQLEWPFESLYPYDAFYPDFFTVAFRGGLWEDVMPAVINRIMSAPNDIPLLFDTNMVMQTMNGDSFRIDPLLLQILNVPLVSLDQTHYTDPVENYQAIIPHDYDDVEVDIISSPYELVMSDTRDVSIQAAGGGSLPYNFTTNSTERIVHTNEVYAEMKVDIEGHPNWEDSFFAPLWLDKDSLVEEFDEHLPQYTLDDFPIMLSLLFLIDSEDEPDSPPAVMQLPYTNDFIVGADVKAHATRIKPFLVRPCANIGQNWVTSRASAPSIIPAKSAEDRVKYVDIMSHAYINNHSNIPTNALPDSGQALVIAKDLADRKTSHMINGWRISDSSSGDRIHQTFVQNVLNRMNECGATLSPDLYNEHNLSNLASTIHMSLSITNLSATLASNTFVIVEGWKETPDSDSDWEFHFPGGAEVVERPWKDIPHNDEFDHVLGETAVGPWLARFELKFGIVSEFEMPANTNFTLHANIMHSKRVTWNFKDLPLNRGEPSP